MSKNDNVPPSRSTSMRPPSRPPPVPLMTPSASPPIQRPYGRQSLGPSPAKKRRVSRTPSLLGPGARASSVFSGPLSSASTTFTIDASAEPVEDLHAARQASSFRVLNVWSQLADKYARRLDEDDIVDLREETIIKDCGVLRSSNDIRIGCFAEEHERALQLDNGQPLTPADDEPDELDSFADIHDNVSRTETDGDDEDELELAQQSKPLPPVRELDPADAADLAEFLKAEQERRDMFGDPDEDDGEEFGFGIPEESDVEGASERELQECEDEAESAASRSDFEEGADQIQEHHFVEDDEHAYTTGFKEDVISSKRHDYSRLSTPSGSPEFDILDISHEQEMSDTEGTVIIIGPSAEEHRVLSDSASEDELGGWDHDEGSTLYSVGNFSEPPEDKGECASSSEGTPIISASHGLPSSTRKEKKRRDKRQKHKSLIQSSLVGTQPTTPSRKKRTESRTPSEDRNVQLQTPPRSTSFGPEARIGRVVSTYSRKKRGASLSPRRTPRRIESMILDRANSGSEAETSSFDSKKGQIENSPQRSLSKKAKIVPVVYIDGPSRVLLRKLSGESLTMEDKHDDVVEDVNPASPRRAKGKGKARATETNSRPSIHPMLSDMKTGNLDLSPVICSRRSNVFEGDGYADSPKRTSYIGNKRRHVYSTDPDELVVEDETVDVVMASPSRTPSQKRLRVSSSRRKISDEIVIPDECEAGPSSRFSFGRHPRLSGERLIETTSHSRVGRELSDFSFTVPHNPSAGPRKYGSAGYLPSISQQTPAPVPNLQDPSAQYHLAQALRSLSFLMGGTLPSSPSPMTGMQAGHPPFLPQPGHQPWPPFTPQHPGRTMNFNTPQSTSNAPPTSSPLGSEYSDSIQSSPIKQPIQERGRPRTQSIHSQRPVQDRPKSAIRESKAHSKSRARVGRRVSFSSPEATQIGDHAYDNESDDVLEIVSSEGEDSDVERRRLRREMQSIQTFQLQTQSPRNVRAQTPGPPSRSTMQKSQDKGLQQTPNSDSERRRRVPKGVPTDSDDDTSSHGLSRRRRR